MFFVFLFIPMVNKKIVPRGAWPNVPSKYAIVFPIVARSVLGTDEAKTRDSCTVKEGDNRPPIC